MFIKLSVTCSVRKHPLSFCLTFIFRIPFSMPLSKSYNDAVENAIRPVTIRKNYLFCQKDGSFKSTAIIYSLMGCCKVAGVYFRSWIIYFLDHADDYDKNYTKDIADLLLCNL